MNEYDIQVDLEHGLVFHKEINLVQNDYNSTVFNFKFNDKDYSNYTKVFQLEYPDGKTWTKEIKENKITLADLNEENIYIPILTQSGKYYFDIAIYDENSKLTTTKKSYFNARKKISGEDIELDDRVPILDDLINNVTKNINETNNLDIDIENSIITITKKDGTTKSENVKGDAYIITEEDMQEIETNVKEDIQPILDNIQEKADTAISIAKGANQCKTYGDYPTFIEAFNLIPRDKYIVGQDIRIIQVNVPDLWVAYIEEESIEYTYTTDEDFINELVTNGTVQVGFYKFGMLETQKVDLTEYVKNTDYATETTGGVVKVNASYGVRISPTTQALQIAGADESVIDNRTSAFKPITPYYLDYAVGSVKASKTQFGTIRVWKSTNEDGEVGLNISTEV